MNETLSKEEVDALIKCVILADEENGIFLKCKKCGVKHSINEECPLVDLWGDMFEEQGIPVKKDELIRDLNGHPFNASESARSYAGRKFEASLIKGEAKEKDFIYKEYPKDEKACKECSHLSKCTYARGTDVMCQAETDAILRGVTDGELDKPELPSIKETGWLCPVCGRGNAPFVRRCNCK